MEWTFTSIQEFQKKLNKSRYMNPSYKDLHIDSTLEICDIKCGGSQSSKDVCCWSRLDWKQKFVPRQFSMETGDVSVWSNAIL